jgi:putative transcriptional regulator
MGTAKINSKPPRCHHLPSTPARKDEGNEVLAVEGCTKYFRSVREFSQSHSGSEELSNSLLIAHPSLLDPNFRRSVVYITAHDSEEGSHGLIINRPTDNTVADLLPMEDMGALANLPVFIGGPVGQNQLTFAVFRKQSTSDIIECKAHLEIEEARELAGKRLTSVRAFIGYAGWSKGQLEGEVGQKSWIIRPPDRDLLDVKKSGEIWPSVMRGLGPWFRLLAAAPDDPSRN